MNVLYRKLPSTLGAAALAAAFLGLGSAGVAASQPNGTCTGGTLDSPTSVAPGSYRSLTIIGNCAINAGNVVVQRNVTLLPGSSLNGFFGSSTLTVGRNLLVQAGASLGLGCDPVEDVPCLDDATLTTNHTIKGNLVVQHGLFVVVHDTHIAGELAQNGGGGGVACSLLFANGPLVYVDYARNTIGGDASVDDLRTCWDGFSHNTVGGSVNFNDNKTFLGDGNLADGNTITGHFNCFNDSPAPHLSDAFPPGVPNVVGGTTRGQCKALI